MTAPDEEWLLEHARERQTAAANHQTLGGDRCRCGVTIHHGDCLDVMRQMPDASVDAIVTDPPYGLGFMGKAWDDLPPGLPWAQECLRILKPGGHLLAFGGTRTWHRLAVAVEDAGFEVRDSIAWLYGSGFPKSLDVSKAIDKAGGGSPAEHGRILRAAREREGLTRSEVAALLGCKPNSIADWEEGRARVAGGEREVCTPSPIYRAKLAAMLGYTADERMAVGVDPRPIGYHGGAQNVAYGDAATPAAQTWQGWGTALKPAFEPIVVARKPLVGTVAGNVLAHGTGALNVDGCRVATSDADKAAINAKHAGMDVAAYERAPGTSLNLSVNPLPLKQAEAHPAGRWPTNVVLDGDAAESVGEEYRFFPVFRYQAKAPTRERVKVGDVAHPTVKPLALMRWLVRLVTPPGGVVLDPFAGSGTTIEAAMLEGFRVIGIEREADYLPLIEARIARAQPAPTQADAVAEALALFDFEEPA